MNNELCHHGVKGQKWGVRRYQNKDGSRIKGGKSESWSEDAKTAKSLKNKSLNEMSNAELRKLNERQQLEQTYRRMNKNAIGKGMQYVGVAAATTGTFLSLYNNSNKLINIGKGFASRFK